MEKQAIEDKYEEWAAGQKVYKKPRLYVREITAFTYNLARELKKLRTIPRVIKGKDLKFTHGPQYFNCTILAPKHNTAQAIFAHMVVLVPRGTSQRHGHMNEAPFYILDGKGYDIHDGKRHDWKAGDVCIVPNACVHQHFNADDRHFARALIIKSKPLYMFMNMLFQETLEEQPTTPVPGYEDFEPSIV
ncbi:MAG: cupin domain-containing protein [Thermodesulfobacteriota bacterium]